MVLHRTAIALLLLERHGNKGSNFLRSEIAARDFNCGNARSAKILDLKHGFVTPKRIRLCVCGMLNNKPACGLTMLGR